MNESSNPYICVLFQGRIESGVLRVRLDVSFRSENCALKEDAFKLES